tara:strand:- start:24914 stop:26251 length:1338 start_codon:yes stop_codon:yes gene_type:complete
MIINFGKHLAKAFFIGMLIFLVLSLIQYINGYNEFTISGLVHGFAINQLFSIVLYLTNSFFNDFLIRKYKNDLFLIKNLFKAVFGGICVTLISIVLLRLFTKVIISEVSLAHFIANEKIEYYYLALIISAVVVSIFYAFYYYKYKQESKVQEQKIIAGTASAQFDALKNQLDPHFLFNSLNVLTSLIEENPEAATKFTTALSKVYRYVLEQKNKDVVTVAEELKFAQLYMSLIAMRFEDSIVFSMPTKLSNPDAKVVPLALQLLLENAVKHNQVTPKNKLYITIEERNGNLVVKNNVQPKQIIKDSSGVGLQNITQRYKLLTQKPVLISKTAQEFSIAIPMLSKTHKTMYSQDTYISDKKYELAKERLDKLKGFYAHFIIYCLFIPVFVLLWYQSNVSVPWFLFPICGWGLGILGHASDTFEWSPFGKGWEHRKIKEMMDKDDLY